MKNLHVNEETMALLGFKHDSHSEKYGAIMDSYSKEFYVQKNINSEDAVLHNTDVTIIQEETCYKLEIKSTTGKDICICNEYEVGSENSLVNCLLKSLNAIDVRNKEYFKMNNLTSSLYKQYAGKYGSRQIGYDFCTLYINSNILGIVPVYCRFDQLWIEPDKKVPATLEKLVDLINQMEREACKRYDDTWIDSPSTPKQLTESEINCQVDGTITKDDLDLVITTFERVINLLQMQLYEKVNKKRS